MARRGIRHRRKEEERPMVDLTPLVDVVFSILIMFIIVAPMLNLDRVELAKGAKNGGVSVRGSAPVTIHVHEDNSIWINQRLVDTVHLPEILKQERLRYPRARPQLYHDHRAQFGTYQTVKNAVESAGFEQLDIILKPA